MYCNAFLSSHRKLSLSIGQRNLSVSEMMVMYNIYEFIHIRVDVYVIQEPTYNLIVRNFG